MPGPPRDLVSTWEDNVLVLRWKHAHNLYGNPGKGVNLFKGILHLHILIILQYVFEDFFRNCIALRQKNIAINLEKALT